MSRKQIVAILLAVILCLSIFSAPAFAEDESIGKGDYPFVFVHGLFGYGARSDMNSLVPYWGMTTGDNIAYFNSLGYECYSATVGPLSSAWDRACELYAQFTGTTVDYGVAHSAEYGHERFGITYDEPLFEGWSADRKINLVGHSFGGATIRMFYDILCNGRPEEVEAARAAGVPVSPFFEGGKGELVYSLTSVSAPHNGTTFFEASSLSCNVIPDLAYKLGVVLGLTDLKGFYDLQLGHFGYTRRADENDLEYLMRVICSDDFYSRGDNALYDLTVDNAIAMNDGLPLSDSVYLFSVTGDVTMDGLCGNRVHTPGTMPLMWLYADQMGSFCDEYTEGGHYIDESWLPNDGLVNVVSGQYPVNSMGECLRADGTPGYAFRGMAEGNYEKGVWNVLPVQPYDHISIVGGILSNSGDNVRRLFTELLGTVVSTYHDGAADEFHSSSFISRLFDFTKIPQLMFILRNTLRLIRDRIGIL